MSTDAVSEKKGLLHELKDGFSIDLTEEEYLAKEAEIRKLQTSSQSIWMY